jgi:hypothetical protein
MYYVIMYSYRYFALLLRLQMQLLSSTNLHWTAWWNGPFYKYVIHKDGLCVCIIRVRQVYLIRERVCVNVKSSSVEHTQITTS